MHSLCEHGMCVCVCARSIYFCTGCVCVHMVCVCVCGRVYVHGVYVCPGCVCVLGVFVHGFCVCKGCVCECARGVWSRFLFVPTKYVFVLGVCVRWV